MSSTCASCIARACTEGLTPPIRRVVQTWARCLQRCWEYPDVRRGASTPPRQRQRAETPRTPMACRVKNVIPMGTILGRDSTLKYLGLCLGLSVLLSACVVGADEDLLASDGIDEAEIEDDVPLALAYCWQGGALPCQGSNMSSYDASTK